MSGLDLLKRIREFDPLIPVIMLTAYGSIEGAVAAVKLGAFDYIKKPVDLEELKLLADRARENRLLKQELSDRKSTRLNSSHSQISYAVFCLKKKNSTLSQ